MVDQNIADKDLCPCGSNKGELRPDGTEKVTEFRFTGNHMGAREPKGAAREPKGAAREPKGAAREPKGAA
ncbi:MAG: hypothetical protein JXM70_02440, partial [Pirellulales bacterium]|nr:hypothetical protein [Pirellulales bacterium]